MTTATTTTAPAILNSAKDDAPEPLGVGVPAAAAVAAVGVAVGVAPIGRGIEAETDGIGPFIGTLYPVVTHACWHLTSWHAVAQDSTESALSSAAVLGPAANRERRVKIRKGHKC